MRIGGQSAQLTVKGNLDFNASSPLLQQVKRLADHPIKEIRLDLSEVQAVDVSGMAGILTASRLLQRKGKQLTLEQLSPAVTRAFSLLNLQLDQSGTLSYKPQTNAPSNHYKSLYAKRRYRKIRG